MRASPTFAKAGGDEDGVLSEDLMNLTVTDFVIECLPHPLSSDGAPFDLAGTALPMATVVSMPPVVMAGSSIFVLVRVIAFVMTPMAPSRVLLSILARTRLYSHGPAVYQILPRSRFQLAAAWNGDHFPGLTCHNHWKDVGRSRCCYEAS